MVIASERERDQLSRLDVAFWSMERQVPMHLGAVLVLDPPNHGGPASTTAASPDRVDVDEVAATFARRGVPGASAAAANHP